MGGNGQKSHEVKLCEQAGCCRLTIHFLTKNYVTLRRILVVQHSFLGEQFPHDTMNPPSQTFQNLEIKLWLTVWSGGTNSHCSVSLLQKKQINFPDFWCLTSVLPCGGESTETSLASSAALCQGNSGKHRWYSQWLLHSAFRHLSRFIVRDQGKLLSSASVGRYWGPWES
jgi:hypothetical protein